LTGRYSLIFHISLLSFFVSPTALVVSQARRRRAILQQHGRAEGVRSTEYKVYGCRERTLIINERSSNWRDLLELRKRKLRAEKEQAECSPMHIPEDIWTQHSA
jgi:hypothetical protein